MSDTATLSPDALARACADAMWQDDRASQGLQVEGEQFGRLVGGRELEHGLAAWRERRPRASL